MTSKLEKIYAGMPVSLQNLVVSVKGWTLKRKRYGGKYHQHLNNLMRSQWFSAEEFRDMQLRELRKLIREAAENTVYYHKTLGHLLGGLESLTLENIADLPLLEKSVLRTRTWDFVNKERLRYGYVESHTSGTSGSPLVMPYDFESGHHNEAFRSRQYRWAGMTGFEVSVHFSGRLIMGTRKGPPFWRYNAPRRQWFFSTYHMTEENLDYYADKLSNIQPVYLSGYPSALYVLARWIKSHGRVGEVRPWSVITTAETLLDHQRKLIEEVFGCRVFDYYSSAEGSPYITQCAAGNYHINPESGIVEILRPNGNPTADGEIGEMVVTSFFQRTVPLIRYRIGDTAISKNHVCVCGRNMPMIQSVTGRLDDLLWTKERGFVSRLTSAFRSIPPSIREAQIAQTGLNEIEVRYVPDGKLFQDEHIQKVIEELRLRLGQSVQLKLVQMSRIPRSKSGKFKTVVREIDIQGVW